MKEYVKFGFGVTMGFALAKLVMEKFNEMAKKAMAKDEEKEHPEEKSKADIWEESVN